MSPISRRVITDSIGMPARAINMTQTSLNAAATWLSFGFTCPPDAKTITLGRIHVATVTGTVGATDITVSLCSSTAGQAGTVLATTTINASTAGWKSLASSFATLLTAGAQYFLVIKNTNGTPASNFCSIRYLNDSLGGAGGADTASVPNTTYGWGAHSTTNSGTTWTGVAGLPSLRIDFSDGSFAGFPSELNTLTAISATDIYGKRAAGIQLLCPVGVSPNVANGMVPMRKFGTPTGDLLVKWYLGATLKHTTTVPKDHIITGAGVFNTVFATPFAVLPGEYITMALRSSVDTDTASNGYRFAEWNVDADADSLAMFSNWGMRCVYTLDDSASPDPTTWGQTLNTMPMMRVGFQSGAPYNSLSSGGSPNRGILSGGRL